MKKFYLLLLLLCLGFSSISAQDQGFELNQPKNDLLQNSGLEMSYNQWKYHLKSQQLYQIQGAEATPISQGSSSSAYELPPYKKALPTMVYSGIIPGAGQAVHGKWIRAGFYLALDVIGIIQHQHHRNKAERLERLYYQKVDENWSVVKYANWLVEYNQYYGTNAEKLDIWLPGASRDPNFNNQLDWTQVDISRLRELERSTTYFTTLAGGSVQRDLIFSHTVPDFGSQQYYELAAKYFQFAPGWRDFNVQNTAQDISRLAWDINTISQLSPMWFEGSLQADRFNNHYRYASNWLTVLIANHVISAFDGFFTAKLAGHRLRLEAPNQQATLLSFRMDF